MAPDPCILFLPEASFSGYVCLQEDATQADSRAFFNTVFLPGAESTGKRSGRRATGDRRRATGDRLHANQLLQVAVKVLELSSARRALQSLTLPGFAFTN